MSRALRRGTPLRAPVDAAEVKRRAKELGADLCGIASAATLNAFPPDPRWPQTPERISPYCKSVIVVVQSSQWLPISVVPGMIDWPVCVFVV